jgi:hypothetical protein
MTAAAIRHLWAIDSAPAALAAATSYRAQYRALAWAHHPAAAIVARARASEIIAAVPQTGRL